MEIHWNLTDSTTELQDLWKNTGTSSQLDGKEERSEVFYTAEF
jgi:hypothetical protein